MTESGVSGMREQGSSPGFRLVTLGGVALNRDGTQVLGPSIQLALLAYLHACPRRCASREHLADTFWSDSNSSLARQALRQNLTRLRKILGSEAFEDRDNDVSLVAKIPSDREEFLEAMSRKEFEKALAAYRGPFFPDTASLRTPSFEQWVDGERQRLRNLFLNAGEGVVRQLTDRGRPRDAIELATRLHREDPESESRHRLLLEVLLASRDGASARAEAAALTEWLKREGRPAEAATVRLVRLAREDAGPEEGDQPEVLRPALVGREKEFQAIIAEWREAMRGPARRIHVEGQAGNGKTRLLEETGERIEALGGRVAYACARPGEKQIGWAFLADLTGAICALPGAKAVSSQSAAILSRMNPTLGALYANVAVDQTPTDEGNQRTLALVELICSVAEESPLALMMDDTQWMDEESRNTLGGVVPRTLSARVLWLSAARSGGPGMIAGAEFKRLLLAPLNLSETEGLLASLGAFPDDSLKRRLGAAFYKASGGSPLLLLETIQLAIDAGRMERPKGTWVVADPDSLAIWLGESNAMEARLKSLSPQARKFLLTLAATGAPLARTDVEQAVESGVVSADTLTELEFRGYIASRGKRWNLAHDTIGELVVRLAGDAERKAVHVALGRAALVGGAAGRGVVQRAARHLVAGGADHDLNRLFRKWVATARAEGDRRTPGELAGELLGELATPERVDQLVGALTDRTSLRMSAWTYLAVGLLVLGAGLLAYWAATRH